MILVMLGTQKQQFKRLLDYIENASINDEIIVQAGHTKYSSKKMKIFDFINYEQMDNYIKSADLIISHGGTGSIVSAIKKGKKVIACARKQKYGEHVDNHQEQLVDVFSHEGYILKLDEDDSLDELIKYAESFIPKKFESNTHNFIKKLKYEIDKENDNESYLIAFLFIFFIFFALIMLLVRPQKDISNTENRRLNKIDLSLVQNFGAGDLQQNFSEALPDQILLSETFKLYGKKLELVSSDITLNLLYDYDRYGIYPVSNGLYKINNTDYLVYEQSNIDSLINGSVRQFDIIKRIANRYIDKKVYAFKVTREYDFLNREKYDTYFTNYLDNMVKYASFSKINSYEDFMKFFYKSDHHWNYKGSYEGYKEIANLLGFNDYVDITGETCFDVNFYGSKARAVADLNITDKFCAYQFDLPKYISTVNGAVVDIYKTRYLYYRGDIPKHSDISHYANFYGPDYGEIIYTYPDNETKENILIFVDSYSNPINELIASHFNKSYIVDLRNYESQVGQKFKLSEYLKGKEISNILFLGNVNFYLMSEFYVEIGD